MAELTHTPGPWRAFEASWNDDGDVRYTLEGVKYAHAGDANLISAAPDLLAALIETWQWAFHMADCEREPAHTDADLERIFDTGEGCTCYVGRAHAAIKKARGETEPPNPIPSPVSGEGEGSVTEA